MPSLIWSRNAELDVIRLYDFLASRNRPTASRAAMAIYLGVEVLATHPDIGRPVKDFPPAYREWVIEFGRGAYIAFYHYDGEQVVILAVRHGREAGY